MIQKLLFPVDAAEAGGKFGAVCFMMRYTLATLPVSRTIFGTRTVDVIMWTGQGGL